MSKDMCQRGVTMHQNKVQGDAFQSLLSSRGHSHNLQRRVGRVDMCSKQRNCPFSIHMYTGYSHQQLQLMCYIQSIVQVTNMHLHTCCCSLKGRKACWFAQIPANRQQISQLRAEAGNSKRAVQRVDCDREVQQHLRPADNTSLGPHCTTVEPHLIPTSAHTSTK